MEHYLSGRLNIINLLFGVFVDIDWSRKMADVGLKTLFQSAACPSTYIGVCYPFVSFIINQKEFARTVISFVFANTEFCSHVVSTIWIFDTIHIIIDIHIPHLTFFSQITDSTRCSAVVRNTSNFTYKYQCVVNHVCPFIISASAPDHYLCNHIFRQ